MTEIEATQVVLQHAEFKAGLAKRGVTDTTKVFCAPFSAGYYGIPAHEGKRLVKVGCFDTRRTTTNLFGWPIERLYALVDFRLDVDIDGTANTFNRDVYTTTALPADSARKSVYVVTRRLAATEKEAQLSPGHGPSRWRILNEGWTNGVGNPVSFEVLAANHARLIIDRADWPAKRALPRARPLGDAVRADGALRRRPVLAGQQGRRWAGRVGGAQPNVRNQDIVIWVNLGMHHLTRAEDIAVMPVIWHSFKLRPHNVFDRNPGIDLRKDAPVGGTTAQ